VRIIFDLDSVVSNGKKHELQITFNFATSTIRPSVTVTTANPVSTIHGLVVSISPSETNNTLTYDKKYEILFVNKITVFRKSRTRFNFEREYLHQFCESSNLTKYGRSHVLGALTLEISGQMNNFLKHLLGGHIPKAIFLNTFTLGCAFEALGHIQSGK